MALVPILGGEIDLDARVIRRDGESWDLTRLEAGLLARLVAAAGAPVSEAEIQRSVWGQERAQATRAVSHTVYRLRKKVERDPGRPLHLQTEHSEGLRWNALVVEAPAVVPPRAPIGRPPAAPDGVGPALLGRAAELAAIAAAWAEGDRLVVLTGAGGVGKTSLARAAMEPGALFVDASSARDGGALLAQLAAGLGLGAEAAGEAAVWAALDHRGGLVVLDNLEQVADAGAQLIGALLTHAGAVRVLATSRIPLRVMGAVSLPIAPLAVPREGAGDQGGPAVDLFVRALGNARPGVAVAPEEREILGHIVRTLDGHPLALELAAARARVLTLAELSRRLGATLGLLEARAPSRAGRSNPRHQSMRGTLDWSWSLLDPPGQAVLAQLSVFAGPFRMADALEVVGEDAEPVVEHLTDAGLVEPGADGRMRLLVPVREYAQEHLPRGAAAQRAHVAWCASAGLLHLAPGAAASREWSARLRTLVPDLLRAADVALELGMREEAGDVLAALGEAVRLGGAFPVLQERLGRLVSLAPTTAPADLRLWSRALCFRAMSSAASGLGLRPEIVRLAVEAWPDHPERRALLSAWWLLLAKSPEDRTDAAQAVEAALAPEAPDVSPLIRATLASSVGTIRRREGQFRAARHWYSVAAAELDELGMRADAAVVRNNLGLTAIDERRFGEARSLLDTALRDATESANPRVLGLVEGNLGILASLESRWVEAAGHSRRVGEIALSLGDRRMVSLAWCNTAEALRGAGDHAAARIEGLRGLKVAEANGDERTVATICTVLLQSALQAGDEADAQWFAGRLGTSGRAGLVQEQETLFRLALARIAWGDLEGAEAVLREPALPEFERGEVRALLEARRSGSAPRQG